MLYLGQLGLLIEMIGVIMIAVYGFPIEKRPNTYTTYEYDAKDTKYNYWLKVRSYIGLVLLFIGLLIQFTSYLYPTIKLL